MGKPEDHIPPLATNRKARHEYFIVETWEAGLELRGGEVKSIRAGESSLNESFAAFQAGGLYLLGYHVNPYPCATHVAHDPVRPKRLLLHRRELARLRGLLALKGQTLAPLKVYLNKRGLIKATIALCKGKQMEDKRETLRRRTAEREADRAIAHHSRRR